MNRMESTYKGLESHQLLRRLAVAISLLALFASLLFIAFTAKAATGQQENAVAGKSFVYTILNPNGDNLIAAYERDKQTGVLTFRGTYPTGGRGTGRIIDSQSPLVTAFNGAFVITVNAASNTVSALAVQADGSLQLVGAPVSTRGIEPQSLAVHNDYLYIANKGDNTTPANIVGYRINTDGTLRRIKRMFQFNVGDNPTQILFNREGNILIGLLLGGRTIECLRVPSSGKLKRIAQLANQTGPFAGVFNPLNDSQLVVGDVRLPGAVSYSLAGSGELTRLSAVSNGPERAACWITAHQNGAFYWVANTGSHSLSLYSLNGNGALTLVSNHSTLPFGRLPFEIVLDRDNRFLYELNISGTIHVLRLTGNNTEAGLEDVGAVTLPAGSTPAGLVVVE